METVLVIADDAERQMVVEILKGAGYTVFQGRGAGDAAREVMNLKPQIIVMAEETPPLENVECLPLIRHLTPNPIIVLGFGGELQISRVLLQGADAYVTRPISDRELLARIRAVVRRRRGQSQIGGEDTRLLGMLAKLTPVEGRIVQCLEAAGGNVASQEHLTLGVWGDRRKVGALKYHIFCLRAKLASLAMGRIETIRGRGYRLVLSPVNGVGPGQSE